MKDAEGHGSNGSNAALQTKQGPAPAMPRPPTGKGAKRQLAGGVAVSSNAQAAQSLMSALRATQAPVHPAMVGRPSPDGGSAS